MNPSKRMNNQKKLGPPRFWNNIRMLQDATVEWSDGQHASGIGTSAMLNLG